MYLAGRLIPRVINLAGPRWLLNSKPRLGPSSFPAKIKQPHASNRVTTARCPSRTHEGIICNHILVAMGHNS